MEEYDKEAFKKKLKEGILYARNFHRMSGATFGYERLIEQIEEFFGIQEIELEMKLSTARNLNQKGVTT